MYSSHSTTSRATGWTTDTGDGGGGCCTCFLQPVTSHAVKRAATVNRQVVLMESVLCLHVRLDEPKQLVHSARHFGEQVGGIRVPGLSSDINRFTGRCSELCEGARQGSDVFLAGGQV